jgi:hypothetical protein
MGLGNTCYDKLTKTNLNLTLNPNPKAPTLIHYLRGGETFAYPNKRRLAAAPPALNMSGSPTTLLWDKIGPIIFCETSENGWYIRLGLDRNQS